MGQAAAKRFADAGASVFVLGRTFGSSQASAELSSHIAPLIYDVRSPVSVSSALESVLPHGSPEASIHTAGINTADAGPCSKKPPGDQPGNTPRQRMKDSGVGHRHMENPDTDLDHALKAIRSSGSP